MDVRQLQKRNDQLERENARLRQQLEEARAQIEQLQKELRRRTGHYRPKANTKGQGKKKADRRRKGHRQHAGVFRETDFSQIPEDEIIHHDVWPECCVQCGSRDIETWQPGHRNHGPLRGPLAGRHPGTETPGASLPAAWGLIWLVHAFSREFLRHTPGNAGPLARAYQCYGRDRDWGSSGW